MYIMMYVSPLSYKISLMQHFRKYLASRSLYPLYYTRHPTAVFYRVKIWLRFSKKLVVFGSTLPLQSFPIEKENVDIVLGLSVKLVIYAFIKAL